MKCTRCGYDNPQGRKFCSKCAAPLHILCPSCQAVNEPGDEFCGQCGKPLTAEPSPPSAAPRQIVSGQRHRERSSLPRAQQREAISARPAKDPPPLRSPRSLLRAQRKIVIASEAKRHVIASEAKQSP